jgi:hypothetical protein
MFVKVQIDDKTDREETLRRMTYVDIVLHSEPMMFRYMCDSLLAFHLPWHDRKCRWTGKT